MMKPSIPLFRLTALSIAFLGNAAHAQTASEPASTELETIYVTAERQLQQSLGVSRISREDIARRPVVNDISELVRTMPGVNLSGNTATGQHGNKRQIDIRGMGPENTLILIDGKPVTSRHATRISMRGERNTRGDTNWVPAEEIESISVLRGPAAARYGSGAMGGVVNITTRKVSSEWRGAIHYHTNQPQDDAEGATQRIGFNVSGPLVPDVLSFRMYGNLNKTEADATHINAAVDGRSFAAGVEGVVNKDIAGRLHWHINAAHSLTFDASFSRQGNIYNGDTQNSNSASATTQSILNRGIKETSRVYRSAYSLSHNGTYDWGGSKSHISYERTTYSRFADGLAGGPEGSYTNTAFTDSDLHSLRLKSEVYAPFNWAGSHVLTAGLEYEHNRLNDPHSTSQGFTDQGRTDVFTGLNTQRNGQAKQHSWAAYVEDNWAITPRTHLIPSLRFDAHSHSGNNISGGLNFSHQFNDQWMIKGGIARAYKAPNLYQTNPNFILYTRGQGCPIGTTVRCYYIGNTHLKPETAINKELGIEYRHNGYQVSLNAFHSSYRNKIAIGDTLIATSNIGNHLYQWVNLPNATVAGLEGNWVVPLSDTLNWRNNFTYMHQSKDHRGNPLSLTPRHTLNSTLAWTPNERWDANLTFTHYGRIKPRHVPINRVEHGTGGSGSQPLSASQNQVASYGIWGINAGYNWHNRLNVRFGIHNLFNKQLYRSHNGAQTFNEHGRAFYGSVKLSF